MKINYRVKRNLQIYIALIVLCVLVCMILFLNKTLKEAREDNVNSVMQWANAIQQQKNLLEYASIAYEELKYEEKQNVDLLRKAHQIIQDLDESDSKYLEFLLELINSNKNIPIIITDAQKNVDTYVNMVDTLIVGEQIPEKVLCRFSKYEPLPVLYQGDTVSYLFYSDSKNFIYLQETINNLIDSYFSNVIHNSLSVPVIITNTDTTSIFAYGNITPTSDTVRFAGDSLKNYIKDNLSDNESIKIEFNNNKLGNIFYKDSAVVSGFNYPIVFFIIVVSLLILVFIIIYISSRNETNSLWVGMSKETAHQLGTPISSLMAWIEVLKMKDVDPTIVAEIIKDVERLNVINGRFSKFGSTQDLHDVNLIDNIRNTMMYIKGRTSQNVVYNDLMPNEEIVVKANETLLSWVFENIFKNAVDAMLGEGTLTISITLSKRFVNVYVSDTGKGLTKKQFKEIFQPGYTTKKRGWGLGLSLANRIIKVYHKGDIYVKSSELGKGTTICVSIPILKK